LEKGLAKMTQSGGDDLPRRWLSFEACAQYLGKTHAALRGLVRRRQIPFHRYHHRLLFDRVEIDNWVQSIRQRLPFDSTDN
jgi:hypothetical protein